ncbi:MAG: hypothetical protein GY928_26095 [Colwellia sp.]|nr:hypothetical protein [Colwellia sp.]
MKCSEYIKSKGVKSLALLSERSGVQVRTLQNWYETRMYVFDAIIEKYIAVKSCSGGYDNGGDFDCDYQSAINCEDCMCGRGNLDPEYKTR